MSRQQATLFQRSKTLGDKYLIGDEIGKGAYGRVHKGVNLLTGDFVAIKQISFENIPKDDLSSIMSEIELLKNLQHRNIVEYIGSLKTNTHLYIILEFVENGSLANIVKPNKFGPFPESLVAIYISQVLEGLAYLHEQGVIHRDIKGANILTTKDGVVKLADFGVATKLTEADGDALSVVGTPYWMAPEVIEMSGVTTSADIWSVGCTAIELLTTVPPFYELQPMSALFRIVKDDSPPLPESISPEFNDFLRQCFQKDSKMRPKATGLLEHPWIKSSRTLALNPVPATMSIQTQTDLQTSSTLKVQEATQVKETEVQQLPGSTKPGEGSTRTDLGSTESPQESPAGALTDRGEETSAAADQASVSTHSRNSSASEGAPGTLSMPLEKKQVDRGGLSRFADLEQDRLIADLFSCCFSEAKSSGKPQNGVAGLLRERLRRENALQQKPRDSTLLAEQFETVEADPVNKELIDSTHRSMEFEQKLRVEINELMENLGSNSEDVLLKTLDHLIQLFREVPIAKNFPVLLHPMIAPLMDVIEGEQPRVIWAVLKLMNQISKDSVEFRELLCMAGLVPVLLALASAKRSRPDIRLEAARLIKRLCYGSPLTLRMLIGCRAIPTIVAFLEPDFGKHRELVFTGMEALSQLLLVPEPSPASSLFLSLSRSGLLMRLLTTMHTLCGAHKGSFDLSQTKGKNSQGIYGEVVGSAKEVSKFHDTGHLPEAPVISPSLQAMGRSGKVSPEGGSRKGGRKGSVEPPTAESVCLERAAGILLLMARGDAPVKNQFCSQVLLTRLLDLVDRVDQPVLVKLLECLKHLALDISCLEYLRRTDAIRKLVWFLSIRDGNRVNEIHTQVLATLYSLCKINKKAQDLAAEHGLIPHLAVIAPSSSPLRQFALPLLCDMAHASRGSRTLLAHHGATELYLNLLEDPVWAPHALDSLSMLLMNDNEQRTVEKVLLRKESLERIIGFFRVCNGPPFLLILEPFLRMMTRSSRFNASLATSGFLPLLIARLDHQDPVVRLSVLKMIKSVYENHPSPRQLGAEHDLSRKLKRLTEDKKDGEKGGGQVLLKQMASTLLQGLLK